MSKSNTKPAPATPAKITRSKSQLAGVISSPSSRTRSNTAKPKQTASNKQEHVVASPPYKKKKPHQTNPSIHQTNSYKMTNLKKPKHH